MYQFENVKIHQGQINQIRLLLLNIKVCIFTITTKNTLLLIFHNRKIMDTWLKICPSAKEILDLPLVLSEKWANKYRIKEECKKMDHRHLPFPCGDFLPLLS